MAEEALNKTFVTRTEWENSELRRKEKEAAAFQRECDQNELLHEIKKDIKSVLEWQSQFKGGLKLLVGLIAFIGTIGGILKIFWPKP